MKTIDELIEAQARCLKYPNCHFCFLHAGPLCTWIRDVLEYLKAYREDKDDLTALRAFWAEQQENEPLTWDELKTMEGKPVWIEYSGYTPNWEIVENIGAVRGSTGDFTGNFIETNKSVLCKDKQGVTWQAYRKERK